MREREREREIAHMKHEHKFILDEYVLTIMCEVVLNTMYVCE